MRPPRPKARSVQQCEIYLDRLSAVMRRAGAAEARKLLPLVVRLKSELAAAKAEEDLLRELLGPSADLFFDELKEMEPEHD
jgi:hypothetical protein